MHREPEPIDAEKVPLEEIKLVLSAVLDHLGLRLLRAETFYNDVVYTLAALEKKP